MTRKDAATLAISLLALVISAFAAYYNLLRISHDASLVLGDDYGIFTVFDEIGLVSFSTDGDLVFVNNGTRAVGIVGLEINLYQVASVQKEREDCDFPKDIVLDRAIARPAPRFAPFVLPAKDVKIIRPTFALDPSGQRVVIARSGEDPNYIFQPRDREDTPSFVSCLRIEFVPAGGTVEAVERHLFHTIGEGSSPGPFHRGQPITLVRRTELPF